MPKILRNIYHTHDDCEIGFTSCFATMFMKAENIVPDVPEKWSPGWCQRFLQRCYRCGDCCGMPKGQGGFWLGNNRALQRLFGTITGIPLVQPDLSKSRELSFGIERSFTHVVEEFDDYISFLCKFAGYTNSVVDKDKGKELIFNVVKKAIDNDKAVMIQFDKDENWSVVVGYSDDFSLYILKWETVELTNENISDGTIHAVDWFETMRRVLTLNEKKNYNITSKDVFTRLYKLMRCDYDLGSFENSIKHLRNDNYFMNLDDEGLSKELKRFKVFSAGLVVMRCIADWYFNNPYELNGTDWGSRFHDEYEWLSLVLAINHDLGHIHGIFENAEELKNKKIRVVLANTMNVAFVNNCKVMSLVKQIAEK